MTTVGRKHTPLYWTNDHHVHYDAGVLVILGFKLPMVLVYFVWGAIGLFLAFIMPYILGGFGKNTWEEFFPCVVPFFIWAGISLAVGAAIGLSAFVGWARDLIRDANR